jgi:Periplasmic copper-binding protein (NosD)
MSRARMYGIPSSWGRARYQESRVAHARWWRALAGTALIAAGCGGSGNTAANGSTVFVADSRAPAAVPASAADKPLAVEYRGPRRLRGRVSLRAQIRGDARIVAATFTLAGRPLGTVTQPPWVLDVDAAVLPDRPAPLAVVAVDRYGRRAASRAINVRVLPGGERLLHASPDQSLAPALRALARGSATVQLSPGRYRLSQVVLGPDARLIGSGPGTILMPSAGVSEVAMLSTRSSGVRISDLAVKGEGQVDDAVSIGDGSTDVRVQRIEVSGVRANGIAVWGAHRDVSIQDSTIIGGGVATNAGVLDEGSVDSRNTSVVRTRVSGFVGYGVLFAQRFYGLRSAAIHNLALDDTISDIIDPHRHDGTDAGGIWTGGVEAAVIGNAISDTGTDGIETVGSSTADTIIDNRVQNTPVAIYLEHSTNLSLVEANGMRNVGTGINVEWRHAGGGSNANALAYNQIAATEVGIFVDVQEDDYRIVGNHFSSARATPVVLQGSSHNTVQGNMACALAGAPFVIERSALSQTGALARSSDNQVVDNEHTSPCRAA